MFCPKCGKEVQTNEKYCRNCGEQLSINNYYQEDYNFNYSNITDEKLIKTYIGANYEKISKAEFSLPALFLGVYYLLYRKMYLYGLAWLIIIIGLTMFVPDKIFLGLILSIASGILFNRVYLQEVKKQVDKIKNQNMDKSKEEILNICKKKGGTNIAAPIILAFLIFIIAFVGASIYIYQKADLGSYINEEIQAKNSESINELDYSIPNGFNVGKYNSDSYKSYSTDYCRFSLTSYTSSLYNNGEEYLKNVYKSSIDNSTEMTSKNINNIEWNIMKTTNSIRVNYKYAAVYNNKIYCIEYSDYQDTVDCMPNYESVIKSLKFTDSGLTQS